MSLDRRISLHKLAVFSLVVELDSVSRAAERLVVSQPVVSAHLRSLEEALRCALWETRGGRRRLTAAGNAVHRFAQEALRATRELDRRLETPEGGGQMTLAASMSVGSYRLARVLAAFMTAHPSIEVREQIADAERILGAIASGAIDFGLVLGEAESADHEIDVDRDLCVEEIGRESVVLLTASGGWTGAVPVTALSAMRMIEGHGADGIDETVRAALRAAGVTRHVAMELGHPEAVKRVLRHGGFVAFLPWSAVAEEIARGELEVIHVEGLSLHVPVHLLTRAGRVLSRLERELVEDLRSSYAMVAR